MCQDFSDFHLLKGLFADDMLLKGRTCKILADHVADCLILINEKIVGFNDIRMVDRLKNTILFLEGSG